MAFRKPRRLFLVLALATICAALVPVVRADIVNGSFETPVLPSGGFQVFGNGQTVGAGWTAVGTDVLILQQNYSEPGNGMPAFPAAVGNQSLDITGLGNRGLANGVSQLCTTTPGQAYVLSFSVGAALGNATSTYQADAQLRLSLVGATTPPITNVPFINPILGQAVGSVDWVQFNVPFVASGSSVSFEFFNNTLATNFVGLDGVALTAVPEPTSLALALGAIGLAAVGHWRRKR
jgi:hypothetical protein